MPKHDVFISYNRKDENFVDFIVSIFEKYDISYFLDKSELKLYDKLDASLKKNVANSKYLISIISPAYLSSYWCLFEAIEAIQGQDLNLKYLPILLRYNPNDPKLDEDYILERLSELNIEIENFEYKIVKHKAYELGSKIDKLNFIKANLPKIFNQNQVNIYPEFELYSQKSVITNLEKLINYINPSANAILNSIELNFNPNVSYDYKKPVINSLPQIKWSSYIGKIKSKNLPLVLGNDIFIGTCGDKKNISDEKDGVYCLDLITGKIKWFTKTTNDVNEILYLNGSLIFGCIDGNTYCISAKSGKIKWKLNLTSAIFTKPFIVNDTFLIEKIFLVNYNGDIFLINISDGNIEKSWSLNKKIRSNILVTKEKNAFNSLQSYMYFSCEEGIIYKTQYDFMNKSLKIIWSKNYKYPDNFSETGFSPCTFYSSPIENDEFIIQLFARQTYYSYPAILSVRKSDGEINWISQNSKNLKDGGSGNLRTQPLVVDGEIIFADAYSNAVKSVNAENGEFNWTVAAGRQSFEQWSSPVYHKNYIYIARHDGHLSKIDKRTKKKEWSIYIGENSDAGIVTNEEQDNLETQQIWWDLKKGFPIYSTPIISRNHLVIGTDEGYLYCISNIE